MNMEQTKSLLFVRCLTYNHAPYIVDAMNGFTMQETNFPFVCKVIDDASTDGQQEIIRKYFQDNFDLDDESVFRQEENEDYIMLFARHKVNHNCFFEIYLLKYNHYQLKKPKKAYFEKGMENVKYIAVCEGDDYWTDPLKLEKQVSFLEQHPDYIMACNRTQLFSQKKGRFVGETLCYSSDRDISAEDTILHGGLYIPSCSSVYRWDIRDSFTDYCKNSPVGDYPLQIMCAMKGKIRYFSDCMSVYRVDIPTSWMGKRKTINSEEQLHKRVDELSREMDMLKGFADDYPAYRKYCNSRINYAYYTNYPGDSRFISIYRELLLPKIPCHTLGWKVLVAIKKNKIPFTRKPIFDALQKRFGAVNHFYKSKEQ